MGDLLSKNLKFFVRENSDDFCCSVRSVVSPSTQKMIPEIKP